MYEHFKEPRRRHEPHPFLRPAITVVTGQTFAKAFDFYEQVRFWLLSEDLRKQLGRRTMPW